MKPRKSIRLEHSAKILAGAIATLLASHSAHAATRTWNNAAGGDFNTAGNWTGGFPVTADTGLFNIALSGNVTLSANATPGSINFDTNADNSTTHNLTIGVNGGNTLTFGDGGNLSVLSTLTGTGKTFTIAAPVVLTPASATTAGAFTIQNDATSSANTLIVSGGISSGTTTNTETLTLGGSNTGLNTISGAITNGSATTFAVAKDGAGTWLLSGANTYNGGTTVNAGTLRLSGASGALALSATAITLNGGSFAIDNSGVGSNNNNRIADTQTFTLSGGSLVYKGSDQAATNSTETIGALSGAVGSTITVSFGSTNTAVLTASSLTHSAGNGTSLINGVSLGKDTASSANVGRFFTTTAPLAAQLVGTTAGTATGINSAVKNTKVVTYLVGEATSTTGGLGTATGTANTFLTYNATTGYRPLNVTDEFTQNATTTGNNIYITSATAASSNAINSLVINGNDLSIANGVTSTNTSGALLFASTHTIGTGGTTGIYTSSAENQITVNSGITGTINAIIGGTQALTKSGAGTLVLSGANTFTGGTTLATGTLNLSNQLALQNSTLTQTAGSSLVFDSAGGTAFTLGGLNGGTDILLQNSAAAAITLTVGGNNASTTYSGVLSGTGGSLTKTGTGTQFLYGANTYTGATVVNGGKLYLGNGATIKNSSSVTVNGTGLLAMNNGSESSQLAAGVVITGTGGVSNEINNPNTTITLDRANTYTGQTTWGTRGIITAGVSSTFDGSGNATSGPFGLHSQINFNSQQATLNVSGKTVEVGSLTGSVGGGGGVQLRGGTITFGGDDVNASTSAPISNNYLPGTDSNGTGVGGQAAGGNVVKIGTGTQTFSSTTNLNSYEGTTTIKGGVLSIAVLGTSGFVAPATSTFVSGTNTVTVSSTAGLVVGQNIFEVRATGAGTTITAIDTVNNKITLSGNVGFNGTQNIVPYAFGSGIGISGLAAANLVLDGGTLRYAGAVTSTDRLFTVGSTVAGATGTLDASGSGALTFSNTGSVAYGTNNQTRTLGLAGSNTGANALAPSIGNNGTGAVSLTKSGVGSWTLTGTNTYTGTTTISAGALQLGDGTTGHDGTIGNSLSIVNNASLIYNRFGSINYGGVISGSGSVTKTGVGTQTLSGNNTYSGTTTITQGVLQLGDGTTGNDGTIGNSLSVVNNASLIYNRFGSSSYGGVISGSGSVTKTGAGTQTLLNTNTYSGTTTITQGVLQLGNGTTGNDGTIGSSLSIVNNASLIYNRFGSSSYGGVISGSGSVTKTGAGTQTLFNTNTYSGTTTITQGALQLGDGTTGHDGTIGNSLSVVDNASLIYNRFGGSSYGGVISGSGSVTKTGVGTQTLSGNNTYSGTTTITQGVLQLGDGTTGNDGTIGNSLSVVNNASLIYNRFGSSSYGGVISGSGSVTKTGAGTEILSNTNTYTGTTLVSGGKLVINGSLSTGAVTVGNNATLGGSGTIGGATTIQSGGVHAPGNSPGIENFTSDLTYADGSIFAWDIDRTLTGRGTAYDGVNVTGTLGGGPSAVFRIVIGDSDFSNAFWSANNHTWTDIFTSADGTTPKTGWASIFGGGFQYYNSGGSLSAPTTGSFSLSGNTLSWNFSAVPEVSNALAGVLLAAGILRRKRRLA